MRETADDLQELQRLLDESHASMGDHMREIFSEERRLSAEALAERLVGVCVLDLGTVTAAGEPRVAPVDGLFFRGRWHFGSAANSTRFRHIDKRPAVSGSHTRGEELAVIVHGTARKVEVAWIETANYGARTDVVDPVRLGRLVDALHARGIRAVAWYLPGHVKPTLDSRRARAMLAFRTPTGGAFDGVALNIESTRLRNAALRSQRAVALTRELRDAAGDTPLAIVPFNPRGLERRPSTWPRFPWAELAENADAFAPMIYTGGAFKGFDATYGYVTRALRLLRANTRQPDVQIHVAGGVANRLGPDELAGFVAAISDDGSTIGLSLYDWMTTPPAAWKSLSPLSR